MLKAQLMIDFFRWICLK